MPLNDFAKKWVEALRSGKYEQGRQYLARGGWFCCLGVACELYIEEGLEPKLEVGSACAPYGSETKTYNAKMQDLPAPVRDALGLTSKNGCFVFNDRGDSLAHLNDKGFSFEEIADLIESEPERLFIGEGGGTK